MPYLCPRPCGRLATAAVFVSVGVVQFIAGLILLKSKYVYLLAAPDFWTSASRWWWLSYPCIKIKRCRRRPKRALLCRRPLANKAIDGPWGLDLCCGVQPM
ncbi:uncharacterized protein TNCV_4848931 [Trichonephila clavipes]|nr:uncharacterized protein TNCV_4848931 [Trichonephila clavipes]